jgi:hypothetical protein
LGNVKIQAYLTAAVINLKRLAAALLRALLRRAAGPQHRSPALAAGSTWRAFCNRPG